MDEYDGGGFGPVEEYTAPVTSTSSEGFINYAEDETPFYEPPPLHEPMPSMILSNTSREQTPFGSPLASPVFAPPPLSPPGSSSAYHSNNPFTSSTSSAYQDTTPPVRQPPVTSPADLADLFGEEQPILPSFKKKMANEPTFRRDMFEEMAAEEKAAQMADREEARAKAEASEKGVLPVSSIGRKKVGGSLATLLGLEPDEDELRKEQQRKKKDQDELDAKAAANQLNVDHNKEEHNAILKQETKVDAAKELKVEPAKEDTPPAPIGPTDPAPESQVEEPEAPKPEANQKSEPEGEASTEAVAPVKDDEPVEGVIPTVEVTATPETDDEPTEPTETGADDEQTPVSTPEASTPSISDHPADPPAIAAIATPLPPSPSASPAPNDDDQLTPTLSRSTSLAPSIATSDAASSSGRSIEYDSVVSPMNPTGEGEGWPGSENLTTGLEGRLNELAVRAAGEQPKHESEHEPDPASTGPDPFASFYQHPGDSKRSIVVGAEDAFPSAGGAGLGTDNDGDSLRGTYSRSIDAASLSGDTETGRVSPEAGRTVPVGSSPALPPLPSFAESAGSPPRSAELGGSLGPSFVITVGDPQKVGSALNVAAQHTVYTVHTRTTHPAFQKKDFSVLRRFSHFLWLFEQLTNNNPGVIVPGMPEKSVVGRFGSEFVENRRSGLQAGLMKIVAHPMLVGDPDLRLFLESDTFAVEIKQRRVDGHHEPKGFLASLGVSLPGGPSFTEFDDYFDQRKATLDTFEIQLKALLTAFHNAAGQRVALQNGLADLEAAFAALAHCELSAGLSHALEAAATVQKRLRAVGEQQHKSEEAIGGLVSVAEGYSRLCASAKVSHSCWWLPRGEVKADHDPFRSSSCLGPGSKRFTRGRQPRRSSGRRAQPTTRPNGPDATCSACRSRRLPR